VANVFVRELAKRVITHTKDYNTHMFVSELAQRVSIARGTYVCA
jgi:hypothetical protein